MVTERLEVRLDRERRRKLSELAQGRGVPVSQAVRQMIDEAYKEALSQTPYSCCPGAGPARGRGRP